MGFIDAVKALGEMEAQELAQMEIDEPASEVANLLDEPMSLRSKEAKILRVWCLCRDARNFPLEIVGVSKVDLMEYGAGDDSEEPERLKRRLLYKEPPGSNCSWAYSPVFKLGRGPKGVEKARETLFGRSGTWRTERESRFYKLHKKMISFSKASSPAWTENSFDVLAEALQERSVELAEKWKEAGGPCVLVFGVDDGGKFLWPGQMSGFVSYFKSRLNAAGNACSEEVHSNRTKKEEPEPAAWRCSSCFKEGSSSDPSSSLDEVFAFSTFDKKGFFPGLPDVQDKEPVYRKVWPVCSRCLGLIKRGRGYLDRCYDVQFEDMRLFVVPEILPFRGNPFGNLGDIDRAFREFLRAGIRRERRIFEILAKQGEGLVFHFVFWEKNQAQERIHLMVEDVPPSRLRRLQEKWRETLKAYPLDENSNQEDFSTLDMALKNVFVFFKDGAKGENQKKYLSDRALEVINKLLSGQQVDAREIKRMALSRLPGVFSDSDSRTRIQKIVGNMDRVIDFIYRLKERSA